MKTTTKAEYVRSQGQTRAHTCHWPGCTKQCPPAAWGCKAHWYALPLGLRSRLWGAYVPGQEIKGNPSEKYLEVAKEIEAWIKNKVLEEQKPKRKKVLG